MSLYESRLYLENIKKVANTELSWEKLSGKSVLIAGATGLIGRCMTDVLMYKNRKNNLGCHIYAVGRNNTSVRHKFHEKYFESESFTFWEKNIQLPLQLPEDKQIDYVIHLASNTHPIAYSTEPINTIITNIYGLKNLLDFSDSYRIKRVVFPSSVEIYGENKGDVEKFKEDYMGYLNSNTLRAGYPESKRCGEALCQAYAAEKGLDIVIARLPRVYGPTMQQNDSKAIAQFIRQAVQGENVILKSKGDQRYSFLYVMDAVFGILMLMLRGKSGEAYNMAADNNDATLRELAEFVAKFAGTQVKYEIPDLLEQRGYSIAKKAVLDAGKIRELGWCPQFTIREGIENTIKILKQDKL